MGFKQYFRFVSCLSLILTWDIIYLCYIFSVGSWKVFLKIERNRRLPCAESNNLFSLCLFKPFIQPMLLTETTDINLYQFKISIKNSELKICHLEVSHVKQVLISPLLTSLYLGVRKLTLPSI